MFGLFKKDPKKKLQKQYDRLLEDALNAQRGGDIKKYAELTERSEAVLKELDALEAAS